MSKKLWLIKNHFQIPNLIECQIQYRLKKKFSLGYLFLACCNTFYRFEYHLDRTDSTVLVCLNKISFTCSFRLIHFFHWYPFFIWFSFWNKWNIFDWSWNSWFLLLLNLDGNFSIWNDGTSQILWRTFDNL